MNSPAEYALALLNKARDDAYVVRALAADAAAPDWIVGFHAQQAVEKAIKCVLTKHAIEVPRTHNLAMLIELLRVDDLPLPPDAADPVRLTPYGTALRYDDGLGGIEPALERTWVTGVVSRLIDWAADALAA
ncbi:MAG: HEPN domain-containing protein [Rhodocyclaceae bacterium]|nr:HEPN domain-containing protein [Rhodocyclaceae bacterium]